MKTLNMEDLKTTISIVLEDGTKHDLKLPMELQDLGKLVTNENYIIIKDTLIKAGIDKNIKCIYEVNALMYYRARDELKKELIAALIECGIIYDEEDAKNINLNDYTLARGVHNNYDIGKWYFKKHYSLSQEANELENYIDFEKLGKDILEAGGAYKKKGFVY